MIDDDWEHTWHKYLLEYTRREEYMSQTMQRLNARLYHRWARPDPNPPPMSELERDIFFRYVDEILRERKLNG